MNEQMPKIIFVDDEHAMLAAYERLLRDMRNTWQMTFVDSSEKALAEFSRGDFDIIVADIGLPGMDGFALLREIMTKSPSTIRLIVSGRSDDETVLNSLKVAHQYLFKQTDVMRIKEAIQNAIDVHGAFEKEQFKKVMSRVQDLPSLPRLYNRLLGEIAHEHSSMDVIGDIVSEDVAMTAKVLRIVNSPYFGLRRDIRTPKEAVRYLGTETLKTMVLAVELFSSLKLEPSLMDYSSTLWDHSITVGAFSRLIAASEGAQKLDVDNAFSAGVLHDVGKIVMMLNFPGPYANFLRELSERKDVIIFDLERDYFGVSHQEVGGYLLRVWGIPNAIVEPVLFHHQPMHEEAFFSSITTVQSADLLYYLVRNNSFACRHFTADYRAQICSHYRFNDWQEICRNYSR